MTGPLSHRRIALAECREVDLLAEMLEKEGAEVMRCPLVAIQDTPDAATVNAWMDRAIARPFDVLILYTGEGVRRLLGFAERSGKKAELVAAFGTMKKLTRGPKPVKALREAGLLPELTAEAPTTEGVIATLEKQDLRGKRIGVQLYGQAPNAKLMDYLASRGAEVDAVAPYVYASEVDDKRVTDLIADMAAGKVAAIAITSSPQVKRLHEVADKAGLSAQLKDGWARTKVASIGPVATEELSHYGIVPDAVPERVFSLKPFVRAIASLFPAQ